jgi:tetratricopeptide (TPR) repeat protein
MRASYVPLALSLLAGASVAQTQLKLPMASPKASVSQTVGITTIEIEYHRPGVKGRTIWGELVPYGEVWRAGANDATTIRFSDPVKVNGKEVAAGRYAFFAIPQTDRWTLILNGKDKQWGSYSYSEKEDALRFDVKPQAIALKERLIYTIEPEGDSVAILALEWEKLRVPFRVEVDTAGIVRKQIQEAIASAKPDDWRTYLQAARYYFQNDLDPAQAMAWVDQSIKAQEGFWNLELKGRMLHKAGKPKEAIPLIEKSIALAKGKAPDEYVQGLETFLAELKSKV